MARTSYYGQLGPLDLLVEPAGDLVEVLRARRGIRRLPVAPELVRDCAREVEAIPHPRVADAGVYEDGPAQGAVRTFLKVHRAAWPP